MNFCINTFIKSKLVFLIIFLIILLSCDFKDDTIERDDNAYIVKINLSGSLQNPAWSPDSKFLVFTRFRNGYNKEPADLYIINIETSEIRLLVSDGSGNINLPGSIWNSNINMIVFSSSRDPHDEIFIIEANGNPGDEQKITDRLTYQAYEPSFSPDGDYIVFESHVVDNDDDGKVIKYLTNKTGDYIELTTTGDCRQPNWSPIGDLILYQQLFNNKWDIWVMNSSDGSGKKQVTIGHGDNTDASFSPDGQKIVYSTDNGNLEFANLYIIPVNGGTPERLTFNSSGYDGAPSWSPDGTKVAFESCNDEPDNSDGTNIWIIDTN